MSTLFTDQLPVDLVRACFDSDQRSQRPMSLSTEQRSIGLGWLRRILLDFESLDRHLVLLQGLYKSSFTYPRPRREAWQSDQPLEPASSSSFTHADRLSEQQVATILDAGIDSLTDQEIADLLLNPVALYDLFDVIDDVQPDHWMDDLHQLATAAASTDKSSAATELVGGQVVPSPQLPAAKSLPDDFWPQFQANLAAALQHSQSTSTPALAIAKDRSRPRSKRPSVRNYALTAAATFACAASLAAVWIAVQVNNNERDVLALLASRTGSDDQRSMEYQSGYGAKLSLQQLAAAHALEPLPGETAEACLERIGRNGLPELKELIKQYRAQHMEPATILEKLQSLIDRNQGKQQQ